MLNDSDTYTTNPVSDLERARQFYCGTLGLAPAMVTYFRDPDGNLLGLTQIG